MSVTPGAPARAGAGASADETVLHVWRRLGELQFLAFVAEPGPRSRTRWCGRGEGRVAVSTDGADRRLVESGLFWPAGAEQAVPFRNVWRWQLAGNGLRLYHERFGAGAPVFLCDFVVNDATCLTCSQPHACGSDRYSGTVRLTESGLAARWRVTGPRKDEQLDYCYRLAP